MKETKQNKYMIILLFIIYLLAMVWIIIFKFETPFSNPSFYRNINLIPFSQPLITNGKADFSEIILNIIIFMPFGVYMELLFPKLSLFKKAFIFFCGSLFCETLQYILAVGASDITDIISNTLGGLIGVFLYKCFVKICKSHALAEKYVTFISTFGTAFTLFMLYIFVHI